MRGTIRVCVNIMGPAKVVAAGAAVAYSLVGVELTPGTSVVLVKDAGRTLAEGRFQGRQVTDVDMKVLGNFVGKLEYRSAYGGMKLATMKPDYPAFLQLPAHAAFVILYYCHNNQPGSSHY